jgi:hypothetical protein
MDVPPAHTNPTLIRRMRHARVSARQKTIGGFQIDATTHTAECTSRQRMFGRAGRLLGRNQWRSRHKDSYQPIQNSQPDHSTQRALLVNPINWLSLHLHQFDIRTTLKRQQLYNFRQAHARFHNLVAESDFRRLQMRTHRAGRTRDAGSGSPRRTAKADFTPVNGRGEPASPAGPRQLS